MGRVSRGVQGIRLRPGDEGGDLVIAEPNSSLLTGCENGYGKRTPIEEYRPQNRGGLGLINIKTTERNGKVVALKAVADTDDLMLISAHGIIMRTGLEQLRDIGRNTQGVKLIRLDEGDKLVAVARVVKEEEKENGEEAEVGETPAAEVEPTESNQPADTEPEEPQA